MILTTAHTATLYEGAVRFFVGSMLALVFVRSLCTAAGNCLLLVIVSLQRVLDGKMRRWFDV